MKNVIISVSLAIFASVNSVLAQSQEISPALQAKFDAQLKLAQEWARDPVIVKATKEHNANLPADQAAMTQEKWKTLSVLDPFIRALTKNEAALFLKSKRTETVGEAFLSGSDGLKVGFLSKTTNWSHKGKPKHDVPMSGKTWQGPMEIDESTGLQQVQVSAPVLDGDKPIGSLVVGLVVLKLGKD